MLSGHNKNEASGKLQLLKRTIIDYQQTACLKKTSCGGGSVEVSKRMSEENSSE